jgi:hypothetical protein
MTNWFSPDRGDDDGVSNSCLPSFFFPPEFAANTSIAQRVESNETQNSDVGFSLGHGVSIISDPSNREPTSVGGVASKPVTPVSSANNPRSRRPLTPASPNADEYYREWVKGNSVANLVKSKLSASAEGRRLKQLKAQEDERRALLLVRRMSDGERDEYFDAIGDVDPVYKRLRRGCNGDDVDMDEEL